MGRFSPAGATIAITIGVSAPLVLIYFALDRIKRLEERLRAIEENSADLTNQIAQFKSCEHISLLPAQRRRTPSPKSVDDIKDTENATDQRLLFMLSPTYSSLLHRQAFMRWAILAKDESFLGGDYVCEKGSDESDNQSATPTVLPDQRHSPLCLTCISRLTLGKFKQRLGGVREHRRVFSTFYKARLSAIQESAETGCTICQIILTTLQGATDFATEAKALQLSDEECFGISTFFDKVVDALTISLNLCGTTQCVMLFQIEVQNDVGASLPGPCFKIFLDRDSSPLDGIKSQPPITDVSSVEAFEQARIWLDDCDKNHGQCSRKECPILPTRILDVSSENAPGSIKLIESSKLTGDYVTLSYCWGGDQKVVLTRKIYDDFLNGVSLDSLPQTIRDAIEVTRKLGLKYLWIDALCIIQDSQDDKLREISQMDAVYYNSYITISAASAPSTSVGFFHPRPPLHVQPLELPLRLHPGDEIATSIMYEESQLPTFEARNNPIEQRGWTLQEKLLSRRVLIYGAARLQWICRSVPVDAGYSEVLQGSFFINTQEPECSSGDGTRNSGQRLKLYAGWEQTIMELTRRALTYPEDALHAIAGIAAKYQKEIQDDYMAGLWRGVLVRELLWHRTLEHKREKVPPRPSRYIAPSWSWASCQGQISFPVTEQDAIMSTIVIKDCSVRLMNDAIKFGDIIDGYVIICAQVTTARMVSISLFDPEPQADTMWAYVHIDAQEDVQNDFRRSRTVVSEFDIVTCIRLSQEQGLVLKQVNDNKYTRESISKVYRRIGYFQSCNQGWPSNCKKEEIVII